MRIGSKPRIIPFQPGASCAASSASGHNDATVSQTEVSLSEQDGIRYLHLGTPWVQGAMRLDAPFHIELEYVQRMMAWLLFVPASTVAGRHAMQLGLGAGAITRFCYRRLNMRCTVVEINPLVVQVCRDWFYLPPDDERLRVIIDDAAVQVVQPQWRGRVDALAVDIYDDDAAAPVLGGTDFYAACMDTLTDDGCITVNLFGRHSDFQATLEEICAVFGRRAVWVFRPTREGNTVVLAQRRPRRVARKTLLAQAREVQAAFELPARKWMRIFKPVEK